jgi:methionyl-tRNA synthetase
MYVWFDALTNYMTAAGYGSDNASDVERFGNVWPADVHLIGKEIVRQHAIYWPAFLMAADLPLPRKVVSHGWWLMGGAKMSKSKGNVVRPHDYIALFGLDAFRYFVFREMVFGQDADFTDEAMLTRYNADLANDFGNLVSRVATLIQRFCTNSVPAPVPELQGRQPERDLCADADDLVGRVKGSIASFQLSVALRDVWDLIGALNRYIVLREPWKLAKNAVDRPELNTSLYVAADVLSMIAELLRPFMPDAAERTLTMLGVTPQKSSWTTLGSGRLAPGTTLGTISPLFPRIEHTVEELRKMADETNRGAVSVPATTHTSQSALPANHPAPAASTASPQETDSGAAKIAIDDFMKVELRVAKVLAAERVPKSTRLLKLQVDTGLDQRTIVAGIAEAYEPEALVGRSVAIVFNLKPAKLMGIESNGMVLAASPDGGKPMLVTFDDPPPPGTRVR